MGNWKSYDKELFWVWDGASLTSLLCKGAFINDITLVGDGGLVLLWHYL